MHAILRYPPTRIMGRELAFFSSFAKGRKYPSFTPALIPEAAVLYLMRAPKNKEVQEIRQRVDDIAKGAALMTGTTVEWEFIKACSNIVPNNRLEEVINASMHEVPLPSYTDEERAFAKEMRSTVPLIDSSKQDLQNTLMPYEPSETYNPGSSDVGDVSWVCPYAQFNAACWCADTPPHSWQLVAQGKTSTAHKGMLYAAKVLAYSAIQVYENPDIIEKAKEEHNNRTNNSYECPIPKGIKPRVIR